MSNDQPTREAIIQALTPSKTPTVRAMWEEYRALVIPADAPAIQVIEQRRAFYAGCDVFYRTTMFALEPGDEPTDNDLTLMENLENELLQFTEDVKAGVA